MHQPDQVTSFKMRTNSGKPREANSVINRIIRTRAATTHRDNSHSDIACCDAVYKAIFIRP
jgi:hypothetical protein